MSELILLLPSTGISRFAWDLVWQSTLVGIVALVFLRFFVRHPATRAWFVVLATGLCVAIPIVSVVVRANGIGLLSSTPQVVAAPTDFSAAPSARAVSAFRSEAIFDDDSLPAERFAVEDTNAMPLVTPTNNLVETRPASSNAVSVDFAWLWTALPLVATACWALLALTALIRLISGLANVRQLCREAVQCDNVMILRSCRRAARAIGLRRAPQVAISPQAGCPTVLAWGRPKLFIPPLSGQQSAHQWFSVFTHELAHVHRGDGWSQLAMEVAVVLLPWQPLIRLLQNEHRQACEEACDDWALFAGADPVDFASTLTEWIPCEPNVQAFGHGIGTNSVGKRIERLLRCSATPQPRLGGGWLLASGTAATCVLVFLALLQTGMPKSLANALPEPTAADSAHPFAQQDDTLASVPEKRNVSDNRADTPRQLVAMLGTGRMQHWNSAQVLGFGPRKQSVFSYGLDGTLKVWDLESGIELRGMNLPLSSAGYHWWDWDLELRKKYYTDVLLSPDGSVVFLGKADGTVELWDAVTFELQRALTLADELPKKLALSADGKRLAAIGLTTDDQACVAVVLDIATGRTVGRIKAEIPVELLGTASAPWRCLALSPDGSKLAVGRNGDATMWDVASGMRLGEYGGGWILRFSPDGKTLVGYSPDQQVKLWDVVTGQLRSSIPGFATSSQVAFDPTGDLLAVVDRSRVRLCRAETGEQLWMSYRHGSSQHYARPTVAFHQNGKLLAISSGHGIALFDTKTGQEFGREGRAALTSLAVDPTGGQVTTGDSNGQLTTWHIANGQQRRTWRGHELGISQLAYSPDGHALASAAFEHLVVWDAASGRLQHTLQPKQAQRGSNPIPLQMAFTPDSANLLVGYRTRELAKWGLANGNQEGVLQLAPNLLTHSPFAMTQDNQLIANSRGAPRGLGIWDLETGKHARHLARYSGRMRFAVSRDGRRIAAAERGDKISVWDQQANTQIEIAKGHRPGYLSSLAFSPDGNMLVSGADDGNVQLWNVANGDKLDTLQVGPRRGIIDQLAFSSDGRYLISRNGNGTVSVLQVGPVLLAKE